MVKHQTYYGCEAEKQVPRERFSISMNTDLLARVDSLTESLHMSRPDVIEVMIAFYFSYVKSSMKERSQK